jgi:hypothetical protein
MAVVYIPAGVEYFTSADGARGIGIDVLTFDGSELPRTMLGGTPPALRTETTPRQSPLAEGFPFRVTFFVSRAVITDPGIWPIEDWTEAEVHVQTSERSVRVTLAEGWDVGGHLEFSW